MKHRILPILFVSMMSLLTTGCGGDSIAGTYSFQMGKETGTHFGVYLDMTDNYITLEEHPEETQKYKSCSFTFSLGADKGEDKADSLIALINEIAKLLGQEGQKITLPAYYYMGDIQERNGEKEVMLGIDFDEIKKIIFGEESEIPVPDLGPEVVEHIVFTTYIDSTINLYIPVGQVDVLYQLYWYGLDVNVDEYGLIVLQDSPYGEHEAGSHPTADDVTKINETFKQDHEKIGLLLDLDLSTYRDYYTLQMGLVKQ